ncbi:MAG: hypothetical protein KDF60_12285 [Calditrichaeota bacterium]|nr:hypothetical protein [Calditrichota bacterium]
MENDVLFFEQQRFNQWWLKAILISINVLPIYALYYQLVLDKPFGNNPLSSVGWIIIGLATLAFTYFFFSQKLETKIKNDGIYVRFFPFNMQFRHLDWNSISKMFVRKYKPIAEFGGWGIRYSITGKGKALNISGNWGLQIIFKDDKKLLIGTQQAFQLAEVLKATKQASFEQQENYTIT